MSIQSVSQNTDLFPSVFNDFFNPWNNWFEIPSGNVRSNMLRVPVVNIMEEKDGFKIYVAVPGINKEDLNIDIEANLLTVRAGVKQGKVSSEGKYSLAAYNYFSFSRSFILPEGILTDKITVDYENGELTLTLPKMGAVKHTAARYIAVI